MTRSTNAWMLYFTAVNALAAALVTCSIVPSDQLFSLSEGSLFMGLALPGHFFFFSLLLFFPLYVAGKFLQSPQKLVIPAAILYSLFVLTIFINAKVFGLYRFHLNGMVLNLITSGEALQILSISFTTWLTIIVGFVALLAVEIGLAITLFNYFKSRSHKARIPWLVALMLMLVGQSFYAYSDARGNREVTSMVRYIPWALPVTAKRKLRDLGIAVVNDDKENLGGLQSSSLSYPKNQLRCNQKKSQSLNIMMLVIDSLRFDMLNAEVMPNAYGLRDSSWTFNDHYSTGNATRFGIFGLLYGLPGSYWFPMLGEHRGSVLFDVLAEHDYQLFINASASWSWPEFDRTVFASVNNQIVSGKTLKANNPVDKRHLDSIVTDDLVLKISKRNKAKPFFGLLFLDAPHSYTKDEGATSPFQPALQTVNYLTLDDDYEPTEFMNLYKNSVHYNDALVGQVIDTLKRQLLLDETVLIITSDHAQEFNDNRQNYWGHNGNFSKYQTKIPLLIRWPNVPANEISHRTTNEDIVPTLMRRVLGCENPVGDYSTGQDLYVTTYLPKSLLMESWSSRALMTDNRIYVFGSYGETRVFDLGYREVVDGVTDSKAILEAMETMGAFLR